MLSIEEAYTNFLLSFKKGPERDRHRGFIHTGPKSKFFYIDYYNGWDWVGTINKQTGEFRDTVGYAEDEDIYDEFCENFIEIENKYTSGHPTKLDFV